MTAHGTGWVEWLAALGGAAVLVGLGIVWWLGPPQASPPRPGAHPAARAAHRLRLVLTAPTARVHRAPASPVSAPPVLPPAAASAAPADRPARTGGPKPEKG